MITVGGLSRALLAPHRPETVIIPPVPCRQQPLVAVGVLVSGLRFWILWSSLPRSLVGSIGRRCGRRNTNGIIAMPITTNPEIAIRRAPTESVSLPASVRLSQGTYLQRNQ